MLYNFLGLMVFFSLLCVMVNNVVVWWSVLLLMTLIFVQLNKNLLSYSSMFNYFVFQESMGLVFLLLNVQFFQLLILLLKVGVAPLHFWLFSVTNGLYGWNLMWFLTFQKLPFMMIMVQMMLFTVMMLLVVGVLLCLLQMLMMKSVKNLLILSSTESFNWVMLSFVMSFVGVMMIFFYYFVMMLIMIVKLENVSVLSQINWEMMLIFMNLPFTVNFYVKIFALISVLKVMSVWVVFLLLLMFMSILSISYWMVKLSTKTNVINKNSKWNYLMFLPFMVVVMI
uniref:NADH dehydrogenase subunit 2 n=1 Tax=Trichostrongylus axei TaxID=40349 RepID=D3J898_TRIAX|nr:NADH dehydrogenase subunit 2 [Trichostrongylus axei]ACX85197.1 NADH dehydrogenase subunit 2 [Trichostrongylus axei]